MIYIIITILSLLIITQQHPFATSPYRVLLKSGDHLLQVPPRYDCSCRITVFSVYNDQYILSVQEKQRRHTNVRVKVGSSDNCFVKTVDQNSSAQMVINSTQYNGYEITESFLVDFYSSESQNQMGCQGIEQTGQQSIVYLVNKTKQVNQGEYQYIINLPKNSIAITQVISFILLILLTHNIKYRRFTPCPFNIIFALIYALFLFVTVYLQAYFDDSLEVTFWLVMLFALGCSALYFIDIFTIFLSNTVLIMGLSIFLTLTLGVIDIVVLPDAWPINNFIAVLVAGALIKFIVIKKLKTALIPLTFLWLFFVFRQFIIFLHLENFQQALQIKIVPLFLQLPALLGDDSYGFICSAFGTSKIITMGLMLNYCVRIDLFLSVRFYTLLCSLIAFVSLALEFVILVLADQIPVMEYTSIIMFVPLSFVLILLLAAKRREWAELWHGSFHDIAIDRKSIRRDSVLDQEQMDRNLDRLKMNPSLLSSV